MLPIILGLVGSYLIVDSQKDKFEDGGSVKSDLHNKFGEENSKLVNFDLNKLDRFEEMQYDNFSKSMSKAEALQILINNVEGDYSQLSERLAKIAEEQSPSDEFADGGTMAKGGGISKKGKTVTLKSGAKGNRNLLHNRYDDFEDFEYYCEILGVHKKLGYRTPKQAWDANPIVESGTNPSDFRKVSKYADGGKM